MKDKFHRVLPGFCPVLKFSVVSIFIKHDIYFTTSVSYFEFLEISLLYCIGGKNDLGMLSLIFV